MTNPSQVNVSAKYGAPMGRAGSHGYDGGAVSLSNVIVDSQGYDEGGAYWGTGKPLFVADSDCGASVFFRAATWCDAEREAMAELGCDHASIKRDVVSWTMYWHAFDCPDCDELQSAPSEWADSATCDCGAYIEADQIIDTDTETVTPHIMEGD